MSVTAELSVTPRTVIGKANRRLAKSGQIPGVLYGHGHKTIPVAVDRHEFEQWAAHHAAGSSVVRLHVEGEKRPVDAVVREIQRSSVKGTILHVDFFAVAKDKPITATVPLHLVNDPAGVRAGGVLTVNVHEISIEALPKDLPEHIEHDVSALEIGDSLLLGDVRMPAGVTLLDAPDLIVASVQAPRVEVEEAAAAEVTEPEVIGPKEKEAEE